MSSYDGKNWLTELHDITKSGGTSVALLHGNTRDTMQYHDQNISLKEMIFQDFRLKYDAILHYDLQAGIRFFDEQKQQEFLNILEGYDSFHGTSFAQNPPRDPATAFAVLNNYLRVSLLDKKRVFLMIYYGELLFPPVEFSHMSTEQRVLWTTLDKWSSNTLFQENGIFILLILRNRALLNSSIVRNPHIASLQIPQPGYAERLSFIQKSLAPDLTDIQPEAIAEQTAGLSIIALEKMLFEARKLQKKIDTDTLKRVKKDFIEKECAGLLEFVEPKYNLSHVAGHQAAKKKLESIVKLIKSNRTEFLPMGYLICGPVGTGKTFLVQALAGEIGIPVVKFKNFRSQWVGVTESNLEIIIGILKSAWPVAVVIDEADAALGTRDQKGDSGTSARVFATLAAFMSDTQYRGKIHWFLMTSRPDLLPVDLKRQGRAEEHIPLFYPDTDEEKQEFLSALGNKNKIETSDLVLKDPKDRGLSGADMESILIQAARESAIQGEAKISQQVLNETLKNFITPDYGEALEHQIQAAIAECTDLRLLPPRYRNEKPVK